MTRLINPIVAAEGQTLIEAIMENLLRANVPNVIPWAAEVPIAAGKKHFRADFMVSANGSHVAVECDGTDYHHFQMDYNRDAAILLLGRHGTPPLRITDVLRFRGCDLVHCPDNCLSWLRRLFPNVFDPAAEPYSAVDKAWAGVGLKHDRFIKPILRTLIYGSELKKLDEVPDQSWSIMTETPFGDVLQLKTPYWHKSKSRQDEET